MKLTPYSKVLIANRGEIAVRIARTARTLGYRTVAVFSDADQRSLHAAVVDEAVHIGGSAPAESYLDIARIVEAGRRVGADAVHPGYGFLAENARFADACRDAGMVFIGPSSAAIEAMGDKGRAKRLMQEAGVPCIPGYDGEVQDDGHLLEQARALGFPLMIKAVAGGGGRGIRVVGDASGFLPALRSARSEAGGAFGDSRVLLEKAVAAPRHVEVQVFADRYGNAIHLGERDCSVQRRHQKLIEEAPSPAVNVALRAEMGAAALRATAAIRYEGAGTIEYLLDSQGRYYFMEMNTRLQVEHAVTEAITGLDLVELQLRIAAGEPLPLRQDEVTFSGHSIEARLCSEDADHGFAPQSGRMYLWQPPDGVRVEHALASGSVVSPHYDSMVAKIVASGRTREEARRRLVKAVEDFIALGPRTNQTFLAHCLRHPTFAAGDATTDFIDLLAPAPEPPGAEFVGRLRTVGALLAQGLDGSRLAPAAVSGVELRIPVTLPFELDGEPMTAVVEGTYTEGCRVSVGDVSRRVTVLAVDAQHMTWVCDGRRESVAFVAGEEEMLFLYRGAVHRVRDRRLASTARGTTTHDGRIRASTTGRVVAIHAAVGSQVEAGQLVITIEAMKMEHAHTASVAGTLTAILAEVGQQVVAHRVLAEISAAASSAAVAAADRTHA